MAQYLARMGIPSSFYLLSCHSYYFQRIDSRKRNPELVKLIHALILTGCEIGLHNDAFEYGVKGHEHIKCEIDWLRSKGAKIRGTAAHNNLASYKAENYEVFKERVLFQRKTRLPIGKLSERKLGLTYEGTFTKPKPDLNSNLIEEYISAIPPSVQSKAWMKRYLNENPYHEWLMDYQFWLIGEDEWIISSKHIFKWKVSLEVVIDTIINAPLNTSIVFVLHPDYFQPITIISGYNPKTKSADHEVSKTLKRLIPKRIKRMIKTRNKVQKIHVKITIIGRKIYNLFSFHARGVK